MALPFFMLYTPCKSIVMPIDPPWNAGEGWSCGGPSGRSEAGWDIARAAVERGGDWEIWEFFFVRRMSPIYTNIQIYIYIYIYSNVCICIYDIMFEYGWIYRIMVYTSDIIGVLTCRCIRSRKGAIPWPLKHKPFQGLSTQRGDEHLTPQLSTNWKGRFMDSIAHRILVCYIW